MKKNNIQAKQIPVWLGATIIFLFAAAVYWPVFHAGFIWDDNSMLTENVFVKAPNGLRYIWFSTEPVDYFPLTYTSLWLEWRLWGMNATGYHVTNLLLHAASSVLLWRIFKQLRISGAFLAAIIFAIHPVNVESVAWIAERKNTLCLFFYTLALLFFLRSENQNDRSREPGASSPKARLYWLSLIFFLLALLSKTSVVMLPFVLLLYLWWKNKKWTMRDILRTAPFFVLSLALGLATVWFQHHRAIAEDVIREAGFGTRFGEAGLAIWFYLGKAIFPARLSFVYPEIEGSPAFCFLAWSALIAPFAVFWWKRHAWGRHLLFSFGYFVLMLLPILGFLNIYFHRYSLVADHWQYFALPGIIAAMVAGFVSFLNSQPVPRIKFLQLAALALVAWLGFAASQQAKIYRSPESLWRDTLQKNPNAWMALNNYGLMLEHEGKINEAIADFEKSIRIKPGQTEAYNNLGSAFLDQGRLAEAMAQYQIAFKNNPAGATTRYNIANALDAQGKPAEAIAEYREAVRLNPGYIDAHNNLGCMLIQQGKADEGMAHLREALRFNPDNIDALNNLARTLTEQGRPREAIPLLSRAIQIKPDYLNAIYNLGDALLASGQMADALNVFSAALKINPQLPPVHYKMGNAFLQLQKTNEALAHFARAVELNPQLAEAHYQAAEILGAGKNYEPAIAHYNEAIRVKPEWAEPLNNLAWLLATCPEAKWRDGKQAVELAERVAVLTENKNVGALDTLAAAYTEAGQFPKAVNAATKAVDLAGGDKLMTEEIRARLELYRAGKPFRQ